jgi:hypothetical protein
MPAPAPTCADELRKIYDAIMALQSGKSVTSIGFGERNVSYGQSDLAAMKDLFRVFYGQCGADSGLVNIADTSASGVERGRPARYSMF